MLHLHQNPNDQHQKRFGCVSQILGFTSKSIIRVCQPCPLGWSQCKKYCTWLTLGMIWPTTQTYIEICDFGISPFFCGMRGQSVNLFCPNLMKLRINVVFVNFHQPIFVFQGHVQRLNPHMASLEGKKLTMIAKITLSRRKFISNFVEVIEICALLMK